MPKSTPKKTATKKVVETLRHDEAKRKNIPTVEYQAIVAKEQQTPLQVAYERRNRDLDPQLVWRGKDVQDWSDLVVHAPPLYIQDKVHPKALIDDLERETRERKHESGEIEADLFADFNGIPKDADKTEFYKHDGHWSNRMILGDSLQVMASLAEREGLRGKVQCIYFDPPYGIKFNSNFQWSTTSRDVKDGNASHITREPEQVKAFRDTWRDGIHSYLTYLRDRLTVARDLLTESGSIFVQIGDENVHRVRAVMDEVFGEDNFCSLTVLAKASAQSSKLVAGVADFLLWFAKDKRAVKYRELFADKAAFENPSERFVCIEQGDGTVVDLSVLQKSGKAPLPEGRVCRLWPTFSQTAGKSSTFSYDYCSTRFLPPSQYGWQTTMVGLDRLNRGGRLHAVGKSLRWKVYHDQFPFKAINNTWFDLRPGGFGEQRVYVVQTDIRVIERCLLMTTDPGDLVLDPTCGSGTTAYVAEQWGRRWITIDTSRVALALARARIMGARYPFYLLADSRAGQLKEAEITRTEPSSQATRGDIRHGFVYERVPHITLKSIANNAEIDVIWEKWQQTLEPLREKLNKALGRKWEEWEIPRDADNKWSGEVKKLHTAWWDARIARQKEIDASIAAKAEYEYLYDRPYEDKKRVRVAGPFTVESLSPHRVLGVDENDELIDRVNEPKNDGYSAVQSFEQLILDNLRTAGVQQAHKEDRISFTSLVPWPGDLVCAEGTYEDSSGIRKRAAIFIGPEFGTVTRPDLVDAAKEAGEADFDVLIACAFSYDGQTTEFTKLGRIQVLKARMNADLHMAEDLKNTGQGNLFVIFGEPDIDLLTEKDGRYRVKLNGVDVFKPQTGKVESSSTDEIACWFIDTDYDSESFFVRHAYFLGANDPYNALRTTLKAEIDADAWATLRRDVSRPFEKPRTGRIAVKVINHLGDEVMKVFRVQ